MGSLLEWTGVAAGSGVLGSLITKGFDWRLRKTEVAAESPKIDAEAAQIIASTAVTLVAPLQSQIEALTGRVGHLEAQYATAVGYIRSLRSWIFTHIPDETPPPPPLTLEIG